MVRPLLIALVASIPVGPLASAADPTGLNAGLTLRAAVPLDDGASRLSWRNPDGSIAWSVPLDAGDGRLERAADRNDAGRSLLVAPRFPPAPPVAVPVLGGDPIDLARARGKVVLLDFWASWCPPCLRELPQLEALWSAERERGFLAIAVNTDDPDWVAKDTAGRLGLTMPIGRYDEALDRAFRARSLPSVVLIDREGRIRGRWDGWRKGVESTIASSVRSLLGEDPEGRPRRVADVTRGAGLLEVAWATPLRGPVSGLASARGPGGEPLIVASARSVLNILSRDGEIVATEPLPAGSGSPRLITLPAAEDGGPRFVGWRPGSAQLITIDDAGRSIRAWPAPAPVLSVGFSGAGPTGPRLLLATVEGLAGATPDGTVSRWSGRAGAIRADAVTSDGEGWVGVARGTLTRFDQEGRILDETAVDVDTRLLTPTPPDPAGHATVSGTIEASSCGRMLPEGRRAVAVAAGGDQLVLVDLDSGAVVWRATWPEVSALAVADLDGDGRDELLVAAGMNLFALHAPAPRPEP